MRPTNQLTQLAQIIDTWVKGIERQEDGDVELLEGMYDYMPFFKQVMDQSRPAEMNALCENMLAFTVLRSCWKI